MVTRSRYHGILAAFLLGIGTSSGQAQEAGAPAVVVGPQGVPPAVVGPGEPHPGWDTGCGGPPACAPYEDCNGPLLRGDPLLDRPYAPPPGWFAALEADLVGVHVKNRLIAPVAIDGFTDTVHLPSAELDWTASPRLEVGYRFGQGFGEFLVSYQSLVTEGMATLTGFDLNGGAAFLKSRLNVNLIDLDYSSREYSLWPNWDMKWQAGVRIGGAFFDSRAEGFFAEERTSNNFWGAGPHLGGELVRSLPRVPGLGLYGRLQGAVLIGDIHQSFEESLMLVDRIAAGAATQEMTQAVPIMQLEAGLSWAPPGSRCLRFVGGYTLQSWFFLGQVADSRAELTAQGVFLRAEWGF